MTDTHVWFCGLCGASCTTIKDGFGMVLVVCPQHGELDVTAERPLPVVLEDEPPSARSSTFPA